MIQGIKYGRIETIVDGATTYIYRHVDHNASNNATDWDAIRIVTTGTDKSMVIKKGCFGTHPSAWS
jgi:hypothetical protein